jgi:SAM-dependent methyltransferase
MIVNEAFARVARRYRATGLAGLVKSAFDVAGLHRPLDPFDRKHGTDTSGRKPVFLMRTRSANVAFGTRYHPVVEADLNDALAQLPLDPRAFAFVDVGSGKGRAVLMAASMGFKRCVGVEYDADMAGVARRNALKMRVRAEFVYADIVDYEWPSEDTVVFLFNPFGKEVFQAFVRRLSPILASRRVYIVYFHAWCADLIDAVPGMRRMNGLRLPADSAVWKSPACD